MLVTASDVVNTFLSRAGGVAEAVRCGPLTLKILLSSAHVRRAKIVNGMVFRGARRCIIRAQSRLSAVRLNRRSTSFTAPQETESSPFTEKTGTGRAPYFHSGSRWHEALHRHYGHRARVLSRPLPRRRGARHTTSR